VFSFVAKKIEAKSVCVNLVCLRYTVLHNMLEISTKDSMHYATITSLRPICIVSVILWSCLSQSVLSFSYTMSSSRDSVLATMSEDSVCHVTPCAPGCCTCTENTATVVCNDLDITTIPQNIPEWTRVFIVSLTNISTVSAGSFNSMPYLTHLYLISNQISHIDDDTFVNLTQLQELRLAYNKLSNVTLRTFANNALTRLRLDSNLLTSVPDLGNTPQLRELYLTRNMIGNVIFPEGYQQLLHLRSLHLDKNDIKYVFRIKKWKNLHTELITDLSCAGCSTPTFENGFFALFSNLETLYLADVYEQPKLQFILKELGSCKKLKKLDISDIISASYTLEADFFAALSSTALEELIISESVFSKIPSNFFQSLKKLKVLKMGLSKINIIETGAFEGLVNLEALYLDSSVAIFLELGNGLFPPSLQKLSLSSNYLPYFSHDNTIFTNLTRLKWLSLSNSLMDFIPPGMFPSSLQYLDLSNIILSVGISQTMLSNLTKLETLDLTSTLTDLPLTSEIFNETTSVKYLKLSGNNIRDLPEGIFRNMKSIESLDLSYNALSSFVDIDREVFGAMPSLTQISLVRNSISHISEANQVKNFLSRNFTTINLLDNIFDCSCNNLVLLQWLQDSTLQQHIKHYTNYTCTSPLKHFGRRLADKSLVDVVISSCDQRLEVWKIVIMIAGGVVTVVMLIILILYCKYRLYLRRLFDYRLLSVQAEDRYNFYVSYFSSDLDIVEAIVNFVESLTTARQQRINEQARAVEPGDAAAAAVPPGADFRERLIGNADVANIVEVQDENVNNAAGNNRVFYEDRDSRAGEWELEQLTRAIYRSTSVILCLTPDYLNDRRRQYEMALAQDAMVHRYGVKAKHHMVLIVLCELRELCEPGEEAIRVPDILRGHFDRKDVIVWNTGTEQQRSALQRRLPSIQHMI
jgi:Leucine-rich repeat (LRR) protein